MADHPNRHIREAIKTPKAMAGSLSKQAVMLMFLGLCTVLTTNAMAIVHQSTALREVRKITLGGSGERWINAIISESRY
jgi:hypothetical protein